ncbi:type II inositol 3,4-bisphosphate 4-phosphatase isoform X1 [Tachysurus ichikawai]
MNFSSLTLEASVDRTPVCVAYCAQLLAHSAAPKFPRPFLTNSMLSFLSWQGTRDPLFLTGVSLSPDWPVYEDSLIKLSVYDVKDKHHQMVSSITAFIFSLFVLMLSQILFSESSQRK